MKRMTTSIPIADADADHLVKYITGEVPDWGEPWWTIDHVSILFKCFQMFYVDFI